MDPSWEDWGECGVSAGGRTKASFLAARKRKSDDARESGEQEVGWKEGAGLGPLFLIMRHLVPSDCLN